MRRFAQTSDARATTFGQALHEAGALRLGRNAFGVMFGQLCWGAYDKQVQEIIGGCEAGKQAMTSIAEAARANAGNMDAANQAIEHSAAQANPQG